MIENDHDIDGYYLKEKPWLYHREDGPARNTYGIEGWYQNGKIHRIDGPALIHKLTGTQFWYLNDKDITIDVKEWMRGQNISWPWDEETQMLFVMKFL